MDGQGGSTKDVIDFNKILTHEEQFSKLNTHLRQFNKFISRVDRDGLCILNSFLIGYSTIGLGCSLDGLKQLLQDQFHKECEYYQKFSTASEDVIKEMQSFLENPGKNYVRSTVGLFFDAISMGMMTKGNIYQIDAKGKITKTNVGLLTDHSFELSFARYSVLHVDPVLNFRDDDVVIVSKLPNNDRKSEPAMNGDTLKAVDKSISDDLDLDNLTTEQLFDIILINPEKYLVDEPPKGVRKCFIYTIKNAFANNVNCDDNGAYEKFGSTRKSYHVERTKGSITLVTTVHVRNKRFSYKERRGKEYVDRYVAEDDVLTVERMYWYNKSIPGLKHLKVRIKSEKSKQFEDCLCVVYTLCGESKTANNVEETRNEEVVKILPHGSTTNTINQTYEHRTRYSRKKIFWLEVAVILLQMFMIKLLKVVEVRFIRRHNHTSHVIYNKCIDGSPFIIKRTKQKIPLSMKL